MRAPACPIGYRVQKQFNAETEMILKMSQSTVQEHKAGRVKVTTHLTGCSAMLTTVAGNVQSGKRPESAVSTGE